MCGISGILHFGSCSDAELRIRRMTSSIEHRGPDDSGYYSSPDVVLGFRRLSIVDLATGHQPMRNEDGTVWVIFNGEIYNHRELRKELEAAGHRFMTDHSDTEVLVHGWEQWATNLFSRLNGMFACAIWDEKQGELVVARDRYGIKPLYLSNLPGGGVVFGSEVRCLHSSGLVQKAFDASATLEYFTLMNNWNGRTPFRDARLLQPGTFERFARGRHSRGTYWSASYNRVYSPSLSQASGEFAEIVQAALRRQLAADVPVMTYLSGGIDSSAITSAAHQIDHNVRAYSCIFDLENVGADSFVDERDFSRAVAKSLDIERIELTVPQDALATNLDSTVAALEYPRMGMAYVNYLIARRVAQDAKVVMSGTGGDEVTGGYVGRYAIVSRPASLMLRAARWLRSVRYRRPSPTDPFALYRANLNVPVSAQQIGDAFTPEFLRAAAGFDPVAAINDAINAAPSRDPWDVVMHVDFTTYLPGLLVLEDKLSMAHSLEARVPLLDNEVVDYLLNVDWKLLSDGVTGKILFREAVRPLVPEVIYRKPKMGFGPPDASWYRGILRPWIEEQLSESRIKRRGVLQHAFVRRILDEHFSEKANHVALIWSLLSFEAWCRQHGAYGGPV
ncbi:asparagine synthase (glutamine-hydrolyzing) [Bradyrhizobium brasilense]|uniref:asparagine synthase (glutamine-hydrolyzing) n=1 Tax=Bradyrhizobium brasilense TaxID=1419277 RepID=UPI0024B1118E|nr:asparagine synthase (glutamine-hydrolyzing) [Bradyrhizobium australafricanum]WFU35751.1 asparagine synthase (glutamine-hydrolyzing) [Bradyrhizobium australafricanum]